MLYLFMDGAFRLWFALGIHLTFIFFFLQNCNCSSLCVRWIGNAPACSRQQCHHSKLTKNPNSQSQRKKNKPKRLHFMRILELERAPKVHMFQRHSFHVSLTFSCCRFVEPLSFENSIVQNALFLWVSIQKNICSSSCIYICLTGIFYLLSCHFEDSGWQQTHKIKKRRLTYKQWYAAGAHMWRYCNDNSAE